MALLGAQGCVAPEAQPYPPVASTPTLLPEQGKSGVQMMFGCRTAQDDWFGAAIKEEMNQAILDRAFVPVGMPDEADLVLLATTRMWGWEPVNNRSIDGRPAPAPTNRLAEDPGRIVQESGVRPRPTRLGGTGNRLDRSGHRW